MEPKPTKIQVSRSQRLLIIEWDDGHRSEYPLRGLRAACPCAECKGGHANMGAPGNPGMLELPVESASASEVDQIQVVGNYALQIVWKDGHSFGIYPWGYLRELCPCGQHGGSGKPDEPTTG
jgi:DUF971 family protein